MDAVSIVLLVHPNHTQIIYRHQSLIIKPQPTKRIWGFFLSPYHSIDKPQDKNIPRNTTHFLLYFGRLFILVFTLSVTHLMKKAALTYLSLFALCCFSTLAGAAPKLINPTTDTLTVGIAGAEPFVINSGNNNFEGVSIEIWQQLADRENWAYNYKAYASVDDALNALQNAQVDLVVGPVSITSKRATSFSFSQPYYQSSLAIASKQNTINFWGE